MIRDPTLDNPDLYEFKKAFFDNGNPGEFLLFIHNFKMTLEESVMLGAYTKVKYLCTLVCGGALCQFDFLSAGVEGTNHLTVETIILGLASYSFPMNSLLEQKCTMRRGMRNPCGLKVRHHAARLVTLTSILLCFLGQICLKNWCDRVK